MQPRPVARLAWVPGWARPVARLAQWLGSLRCPARPCLPRTPWAAILTQEESCKQSAGPGAWLGFNRGCVLASSAPGPTEQTEHDCLLSGFIDSVPASQAGGPEATPSLFRLALPPATATAASLLRPPVFISFGTVVP